MIRDASGLLARLFEGGHTGQRPQRLCERTRKSEYRDIVPFADFLAGLVKKGLAGEALPAVPRSS